MDADDKAEKLQTPLEDTGAADSEQKEDGVALTGGRGSSTPVETDAAANVIYRFTFDSPMHLQNPIRNVSASQDSQPTELVSVASQTMAEPMSIGRWALVDPMLCVEEVGVRDAAAPHTLSPRGYSQRARRYGWNG